MTGKTSKPASDKRGTEGSTVYVTKGTRVKAQQTYLPCLSGMQMKVGLRFIEGVVVKIRGDHPTEPTEVKLVLKTDDGSQVVVDQREIIEVL